MHISKIFAAGQPNGDVEAVRQFSREAVNQGAHAAVLLGPLTRKSGDPRQYGAILKALGEPKLPAFYIPGEEDAPIAEFLREAANVEIVFPELRGVHGTFALMPGAYVVFAGMGGAIADDPKASRDENQSLRYPGWEVEYRLKFLKDLKDYQKVFLFTTPPAHKTLGDKGSTELAELIKTYNPGLVLTSGTEQKHELVGNSLVVHVGNLSEGSYSFVDIRNRNVASCTLRHAADAA